MNRIIISGIKDPVNPLRVLEELNKIIRHKRIPEDGEGFELNLYDMKVSVKYNKGILSIKGEKE